VHGIQVVGERSDQVGLRSEQDQAQFIARTPRDEIAGDRLHRGETAYRLAGQHHVFLRHGA